jgi:hypothetical protein
MEHEYQDGIGIQSKRQMQLTSTKNKIDRPTASSRLSSHRTGPRCPTSVYLHDDNDDDGDDDDDDDDDDNDDDDDDDDDDISLGKWLLHFAT